MPKGGRMALAIVYWRWLQKPSAEAVVAWSRGRSSSGWRSCCRSMLG